MTWSDFHLPKVTLVAIDAWGGKGKIGRPARRLHPGARIHPGGRWLRTESRWHQCKWWEVVRLRIYLESRIICICCWIGCDVWERGMTRTTAKHFAWPTRRMELTFIEMGKYGGESRFDGELWEYFWNMAEVYIWEFKVVTGYSHLESQRREKDWTLNSGVPACRGWGRDSHWGRWRREGDREKCREFHPSGESALRRRVKSEAAERSDGGDWERAKAFGRSRITGALTRAVGSRENRRGGTGDK